MTARTPISLNRLSPLQRVLAIATALLLVAVIVMVVVSLANTRAARAAFESGYVLTDVANVEQALYRLHLATDQALEDPRNLDLEAIDLRLAVLENQLRMSASEAARNREVATGLGTLRREILEFRLELTDLQREITPGQLAASRANLETLLIRMEGTARQLYDRQEAGYFGELNQALGILSTSQAGLLVLSAMLIGFGALLAVSLSYSVRQEFDRAYRMLESLYQADEDLHRGVQIEQVFQALVDVAVDQFGADKSVLSVRDPERDQLVLRATRGFDQDLVGTRTAPNDGAVAESARSGRLVAITDTARESRTEPLCLIAGGVRAGIHVPIMLNDEVYGVLSVCYEQPHAFDDDDHRLIQALSRRAASAIQNARLYEHAQQVATVEERQRLARELHDAVTQTLFSASLIAEVLPRIWERAPEQAGTRLQELRQLTRGALAEMRTLLVELRPSALMETPLEELLPQLVEAMIGRSRIPLELVMEGDCLLDPVEKVALYRIAQEALNNMAKHSRASWAQVHLSCGPDEVTLRISDDGCGFDLGTALPNHLGMSIMQERADAIGAQLTVKSVPKEGTHVSVVYRRPSVEEN